MAQCLVKRRDNFIVTVVVKKSVSEDVQSKQLHASDLEELNIPPGSTQINGTVSRTVNSMHQKHTIVHSVTIISKLL